ncbi:TetR family transcriptional regulator [Kribbella amoyensis]|uniref:TetR family transcriptional regulator n=1 Tax=Kribbella amoyensis TaxID=996641 RepID=A0A561BQ78_9ACTN|nr:TetR/AcrR family transcriptional regulator [Kribbella amoyensis]TWD80964.1 TetR family transcriptional regulator [Kribbella amoyensis]
MEAAPLRDRLVQAGVELLEETGPADLSLRAITRRAGVSHGAPRRYFPTHNALLAAIAATGLADLAERLAAPIEAPPGSEAPRPAKAGHRTGTDQAAEARLVELARRYLAFAAERPAMFELIFRHDLLEGAGGNLRRTSLPLLESIATLIGTAAPDTDDTRERALGLWTNLHGVAVLRATRSLELTFGGGDPAVLADRAVRAYLR